MISIYSKNITALACNVPENLDPTTHTHVLRSVKASIQRAHELRENFPALTEDWLRNGALNLIA